MSQYSGQILVTSAAGKVGREVVSQLKNLWQSASTTQFKAASSNPERAQQQLGSDVPVVLLNYDQPETYTTALAGVDRIFLLHPISRPGMLDVMRAFVDAAVQHDVKQIVFMAALGADRHPNDPIHLLGQYVAESGLQYALLFPNWFMQNLNNDELQRINTQNQLMLPSGDSRLSLIDTRDIAAVAVRILQEGMPHHGKSYTLTGSEAVSYTEVADKLSQIAGRKITHLSPNAGEITGRMRQNGVPEEIVAFMDWLYDDIAQGYTAQITDDVQRITGRAPITLDQFLADYANVWKLPPSTVSES